MRNNEIPGILERALQETVLVSLPTADEARRWRFRVLNHIKRHAPEMQVLMVSLHDNQVKIRVPNIEVETLD